MKNKLENFKLPKNFIPEKYDLELTPDINDFSFNGKETIYLKTCIASDTIILNAKDLTITEAYLSVKNEILKPKEI